MATIVPVPVDSNVKGFNSFVATSTANADTFTIYTQGVKSFHCLANFSTDSVTLEAYPTSATGTLKKTLATFTSGTVEYEDSDLNYAKLVFTRSGAVDTSKKIEFCTTSR